MIYPHDQQPAIDVDWFAVDNEGWLAHFASAGKPLPKSVAEFKDDNAAVRDFFRSIPPVKGVREADPGILKFVALGNNEQASRYLDDFRSMGSRGLYSYDTSLLKGDHLLFRVYSPFLPLNLSDLPGDVAIIVRRTLFLGRFTNASIINIRSIS